MILRFSDIDKVTPYVGRRARWLAELVKNGFPIPDGFVIAADSYSRYMKPIEDETRNLADDNAAQKASKILGMLQNSPYPSDVESETDKTYREMDLIPNLPKEAARFMAAGKEISNVAVRISNESELPLVPSFLNLRGNSEVTIAIRKMFAVAFSRGMLHYKIKKAIPDQLMMENAVIVQKFVPGELFGTVMKHPFDDSKWLVEYCEAKDLFNVLLYGSSDPNRLVIDGLSIEIIKDQLGNRMDFAGGKYSIRKIVDYAEKAEALLDGKIALEFCVARDRIWVIGAKPAKDFSYNTEGTIRKSGGEMDKKDILLLDNCNVDIIPFADKVSGIIARHGSYSSRMAMVCREMGVPLMISDIDIPEKTPVELRNGELVIGNIKDEPEEMENALEYLEPQKEPHETPKLVEEHIQDFGDNIEKKNDKIPLRISKLCVQIENLSELKDAKEYDEVLTFEPSIPMGSEGWMYVTKQGDLPEFLKRVIAERNSRIIFESLDPERMRELEQKKVGMMLKTPYEMLKTHEISSVAGMVVLDITNIALLLANETKPVFDDVILKQIASAIRYFRDHDVECYCSNVMVEGGEEEIIKSMILIGADGFVVKPAESEKADLFIQKAERKILLELARKSLRLE